MKTGRFRVFFYCRGIKMALPHEIIEFLDGLIGGGGVQVAVCPECRLDIFMAQALTHQQHRRSQPDQQGGVGVPEIVQAYLLDPAGISPLLHLPVEVGLCVGK